MSNPLRLGVAGLGTVGASLVRLIESKRDTLHAQTGRDVIITAVSARNRNRDRGVDLSQMEWFDDPVALAQSGEIDCFVELIGGEDGAALSAVTSAINSGKSVVTANKALLAKHGNELGQLAVNNNVHLGYEAAIAGGIPIVKTLREGLAANTITQISGILNGTCNYILSRMDDEGIGFEECLKDAQELGYAEADPTFDIEGFDAAHKLALLTSLAFGTEIAFDDIYIEGITRVTAEDMKAAAELGFKIKLLGISQKTASGIEQRIHPTLVPKDSRIAQVNQVTNAVQIDSDVLGRLLMSGPGAGGDATASAVISDISDVASGKYSHPFGLEPGALKKTERAKMRAHMGGYYVRLSVYDRPGAMAAIATRMAEQEISLESIVQKNRDARPGAEEAQPQPQPVILVTYATTESAMKAALKAIEDDGHIAQTPQFLRIER